jgi:hypothetical protein
MNSSKTIIAQQTPSEPESFKRETTDRSQKKPKKEKDPDAPKRPPSAYMLWKKENYPSIKSEHFPVNEDGEHCYPDGHDNAGEPLVGSDKATLITKKAGELWKKVSVEDRAPFQKLFEEASLTYKEEIWNYTIPEPKVKYDVDEVPEAPEGWTGPHMMTYIYKVSKDPDTEKNLKSFKSFDDAVAAANDLEEGCSGITKTSTGYSLRVGPKLRVNPEATKISGIASWVKGSDEPTIVESSPKSSPKLKKKVMPKHVEQIVPKLVDYDDDDDDEYVSADEESDELNSIEISDEKDVCIDKLMRRLQDMEIKYNHIGVELKNKVDTLQKAEYTLQTVEHELATANQIIDEWVVAAGSMFGDELNEYIRHPSWEQNRLETKKIQSRMICYGVPIPSITI